MRRNAIGHVLAASWHAPGLFLWVLAVVAAVSGSWGPAYGQAAATAPSAPSNATTAAPDVSGLPLIEVPAGADPTDMMGVFISGDGGWWTLDRSVSETLAQHGISMVGVSSYKYFKTAHTPDSVAQDVVRILRHYLAKWHKEGVVLIGYSLGADVMPFVAARLPEDLRKRVRLVALIGPSADTAFEFHLSDWVVTSSSEKTYPVKPEIEKLKGLKILCVSSEKDATCICSQLSPELAKTVTFPGDHHFGGVFKPIGEAIWKECPHDPPAAKG